MPSHAPRRRRPLRRRRAAPAKVRAPAR